MEIVPDTSVVIDGRLSERVETGEYAGATVVVPEAVIGELEHQANEGRDTGWDGLEELQRLVELEAAGEVAVEYVGRRADESDIRRAGSGAIDALIRDIAEERDAELFTSDIVQAEVAAAKGIAVEYVEPKGRDTDQLSIERLFDDETMSVHLKTGVRPMAKRGDIGDMHYERIGDEVATEDQLKEWSHDVEETARASPEGFIEIDEPGMTIVQFRTYRNTSEASSSPGRPAPGSRPSPRRSRSSSSRTTTPSRPWRSPATSRLGQRSPSIRPSRATWHGRRIRC